MIRIRVDDFPHTSKREPQHTLGSFRDFHRTVTDATGRRYLLGVVPGQCAPEDLLFLRNETDVVVGMHGTDHDEEKLNRNGGNQFEPYLTNGQVEDELRKGRNALETALSRPVIVYMPPRNVVDRRTLLAAANTGFHYFTSGPETDPGLRLDPNSPLIPLHSFKPHEYGRSDEMWSMGSHRLLTDLPKPDIVLTLHWTWEVNIGLQHLRKFLQSIPRELFIDFDTVP